MAIDKAKSSSLSTAARVNSMMTTMSHRIPHRFVSATSITPQNCIVCKKRVWSLKASVGKCSSCGLFVHEKCSNLALPTCGLSMGMLSNALLHSHIMPKSTTGISNNHLEGATSHSFKSKPYPNPVPCIICDKPIWGIQLGGVNCSDCGLDLHEGCSENGNLPICCDKELLNQKENISHQDISPTSSTLPRRGSVKNRKLESLTRITRRVVYTRPIVLTAGQNENTPSFEVIQNIDPEIYERKEGNSSMMSIDTPDSSPPKIKLSPKKSRLIPESPIKELKDYRRKVHCFRGHEYLACYLETDEGNLFSCELCRMPLGDNGRQCYQCRLCRMHVHRKCYTKTKPCNVSITAFVDPTTDDPNFSCAQASIIHARTSQPLVNGFYMEDFSDELVRLDSQNSFDSINNCIEDYNISESILGAGQFGVVKRGTYKHNNEQIAIKIIDKKRLLNPLMQKKKPGADSKMPTILKRELDILQKLDHVGIIRMHHYMDSPTHTMVIMDLAPSGDLLGYVMDKIKLSESMTKPIIKQVVVALKYLHDNNVIHRDLKPENLLLFNDSKKLIVKIADFGFATIMEKVTGVSHNQHQLLQSVVGTPAYMAPEIVDGRVWQLVPPERKNNGKNGYDKSADMWSLGCIIYICLGGIFPFDASRPVLDQLLRGEFNFPDEHFGDVSDLAIELCCYLLTANPYERLHCQEVLNHQWFA